MMQLRMPQDLLARMLTVGLKPVAKHHLGQPVRLAFSKDVRPSPEVFPLGIDLSKDLHEACLRLGGIACFQASRDLSAAKQRDEVSGNALPNPENSVLGCLKGRVIGRAMWSTRV